MKIAEVLPVLIPGVLLQISLQVLYIRKCLTDERLTPKMRRIYALMILIFNLPAVAVYHFNSKESLPVDARLAQEHNVNSNIRKGIFLLLIVAYEVLAMHVLADNSGNQFYEPLTMLISACFIAMLIHNFVRIDSRLAISYLLPALQILLSIPILFLDHSGDSLYLVLVMGISVLNRSSLPLAKVYGVCVLSAYLLGNTANSIRMFGISEMSLIVRFLYLNTLLFMAALTAFYSLKKQMITNDRLDAALQKVREQSEQLRDMAVIEERNRIAAEMHDSVGHTLIAAILTLETAENLLEQQSQEPRKPEQPQHLQKSQQSGQPQQPRQPEPSQHLAQVLVRAKELVRCGISELGASVRAARAKKETKFTAALEQLLREIGDNTGLVIKSVIGQGVEENLPPLQAGILLSAVKECATNALKHGHASQADVLVQEYKGQIQLAFTDNGVGTAVIQTGSGLSIMRERITGIGGKLETESAPGEGFTVSITIPAGQRKGEAYESNQRITGG